MMKYYLGPPPSVWIMQVSLFLSVHVNTFHCIKCVIRSSLPEHVDIDDTCNTGILNHRTA